MTTLTFLAQAAQDISSVDPAFVKNFMVMIAYVLGLAALAGVGYVAGRKGTKGNPLHVEQPVSVDATVSHAPVYAHHSELDAIKQDIERRSRENLRQHEGHRDQLAEVIAAGNDRLQSMLTALHDMETRMTSATLSEIRSLHERINPLDAMSASNKASIEALQGRMQHLWEMIQQLWSHVFSKPAPRK